MARWWAMVPRDQWPAAGDTRQIIQGNWAEPFGDRRQEIVLIGIDLDRPRHEAALSRCLLTDKEMAGGPESWASLPDPLPEWPTTGGEA